MRIELDTTTLRILDRSDWQGPSFESIHNVHLFGVYTDTFPLETKDVVLFADQEGLLIERIDADREQILTAAKELVKTFKGV